MGPVTRMGGLRNMSALCWKYLKGRDNFEDLGVDEKIILN
jgi:hypothetical protein